MAGQFTYGTTVVKLGCTIHDWHQSYPNTIHVTREGVQGQGQGQWQLVAHLTRVLNGQGHSLVALKVL